VAIDWSFLNDIPGAIPKGRVKALEKQDKQAALLALDKKENAKAKKRAGGRCEVLEVAHRRDTVMTVACLNKGTDPHHLIGGIGRRNKGKSILAEYKLWVCRECHNQITANILKPTTAEHDASTVRFWRAR
jgi:hypothetical protein